MSVRTFKTKIETLIFTFKGKNYRFANQTFSTKDDSLANFIHSKLRVEETTLVNEGKEIEAVDEVQKEQATKTVDKKVSTKKKGKK